MDKWDDNKKRRYQTQVAKLDGELPNALPVFKNLDNPNDHADDIITLSNIGLKSWIGIRNSRLLVKEDSISVQVRQIAHIYDKVRCSILGCRTSSHPCNSFSPHTRAKDQVDFKFFVNFLIYCEKRKYNPVKYVLSIQSLGFCPPPGDLTNKTIRENYKTYSKKQPNSTKIPLDYVEKIVYRMEASLEIIKHFYVSLLSSGRDYEDTVDNLLKLLVDSPEGYIDGVVLSNIDESVRQLVTKEVYISSKSSTGDTVAGYYLCPIAETVSYIAFQEMKKELFNWILENRVKQKTS